MQKNVLEMKLDKKIKLAALVFVLVVLFVATYAAALFMFGRGGENLSTAAKIDLIVSADLQARGLYPPNIKKNSIIKRAGEKGWEQIELVVNVNEDVSLAEFIGALKGELDLSTLVVVEETGNPEPSLLEHQISIYEDDLPVFQILFVQECMPAVSDSEPAPEEDRPKMAFIVDDAGYDLERALELLNLRQPMSISVLPKLKYSTHIAELAHEMGYEVMMHLPMESDVKLRRSPGFVTSQMSEKEMYWVLDRNLQSIPYAVGINNHQGSMMTRDPEAMGHLIKYLAEKDMFFVDSRTSSESIAYRTARELGLPAAENDVFLDNEKDVEYIKERIQLMIEEAKQTGKAIGICHVHPETTKALHEMLPVIEEEGIELVFASDLVE